ncbi:MAG: SRPBCC domain-containing protein [Bacteroidia bacterium]|nr:SRPBCC domain-containing protein [Bacteroidia bacterium]
MKDLYKEKKYLEPLLILEHKIEAPKESVYQAWTNLDMFKKWFCPTGFTIAKAEMTAEPGGYFSVHMKSPEGEIYPTRGEYILLEKPDRIVYKDSWDDDRENNDPVICEIRFNSEGTNTLLRLYSSFKSDKQKQDTFNTEVLAGWKMFLENLNEVLKIKQ